MEYIVVPFVATLNQKKETTSAVAIQLEKLIASYSDLGWQYVRLESVSTYVQPDAGCFGVGGRPGYFVAYQMIVLSKD